MMGSQSEILFHEILYVQKIGWTKFFFSALKFGRNSWKNHPVRIQIVGRWHCLILNHHINSAEGKGITSSFIDGLILRKIDAALSTRVYKYSQLTSYSLHKQVIGYNL